MLRVAMDHFATFYRNNSRMPGPLSRDSAHESVIQGVIAPPPASYDASGNAISEAAASEAAANGDYTLTGLEAMERAGSWAEVGGADDWRNKWLSRDITGGASAVAGVQTAPGFGSMFAVTECLPYASAGMCALHGAPILPDSLANSYNVASASNDLLGRPGRFERCGCGMKNTKIAYSLT